MYRNRFRKMLAAGGFTLIEIMVVVVILGILAAVVFPSIMDRPDQARQVKARQDIKSLVLAAKLYRLDNASYPATLNELVTEYLDGLPDDPWGNPYIFVQPGVHKEIDIYSYGADGSAGGSGFDADLGNWQ